MNAIVPRNTVEQIVEYRNRALELFETAHAKLEEAFRAEVEAIDMARRAFPSTNAYNAAHEKATRHAMHPISKLPFDSYMAEKRRIIDLTVWAWIVERTDLEHLMDTQAKNQLREQMKHIIEEPSEPGALITQEEVAKGMPPVTVENIMATLEQFAMDADLIFRRGIANAFAKLDRRFRSHDGFKVGSRIILSRCFSEDGYWNYRRDERETLIDIERTFAVLDGKLSEVRKQDAETAAAKAERRPPEHFTRTIGAIDLARYGTYGARQTEVETDYLKIRIFKNGNAHLWMLRKDLVTKVNKLLAEYYGEVIADGQTKEDGPLENVKTTPARYFGFYPTPSEAGRKVIDDAKVLQPATGERLRILEPSAGTGNLARLCLTRPDRGNISRSAADYYRYDNIVDCVEIQPHLANELRQAGIYSKVLCCDFVQLSPSETGLYDRVVMNPPFDMERDIDHVVHALQFLKDDGLLVAIMSAGTEFRQTRKAVAFRKLMEDMGADWYDLPPGSFSSVGTNVNTGYIVVQKNGKNKGKYDRPTWQDLG